MIRDTSPGFTLVEMIVAVALFAIVMVVAVGALLSLTGANKKAQAIQSVMNNLNITLDSMVRNIRMGTEYHCRADGVYSGTSADSCPNGDSTFSFACNPGTTSCGPGGSRWTYSLCGTAICRNGQAITAPEVIISDLTFFVVGTQTRNYLQPKVVMVVTGTAGGQNVKTRTTFHIQATAVQRELDL